MSVTTTPVDVLGQTRAARMRQPRSLDVTKAAAEQHGVCVRPFTMEVQDPDAYEVRYVAVPCGSTVESVCKPCARKAKALRMVQCREGWHMESEPDFTPEPPTADQKGLLEFRADLVVLYRQAEGADAVDLLEEIHSVDDELRQLGVRGRFPSPDPPSSRLRSGRPSAAKRHRTFLGGRSRSARLGGSSRVPTGRRCSSC